MHITCIRLTNTDNVIYITVKKYYRQNKAIDPVFDFKQNEISKNLFIPTAIPYGVLEYIYSKAGIKVAGCVRQVVDFVTGRVRYGIVLTLGPLRLNYFGLTSACLAADDW